LHNCPSLIYISNHVIFIYFHLIKVKQVAQILSELDSDKVKEFLNNGDTTIDVDGGKEVVKLDEVQILQETAEGFTAETEAGLTVVLDSRLTPELKREGMARDLVNRIQNFRKESGLEVSDRIELAYAAADEMAAVFKEFGDHICTETLAESINEGEKNWQFKTDFELNGREVRIMMKKV